MLIVEISHQRIVYKPVSNEAKLNNYKATHAYV